MTVLDTLTQAAAILDRWADESAPWISSQEYFGISGAAVSVLLGDNPGSVRNIIRDAIERGAWTTWTNTSAYLHSEALAMSALIIELDKEQS